MSFLPTGYKEPVTSKYMKFEKGENRFRVLDSAIIGWEWWEDKEDGGRKPIRVRMNETVPSGQDTKHFWAFPVWNYQDEQIQILEITQKGIQRAITALARNQKWGDPKEYDIVVSRTGEGMETEYVVQPNPKEEIPTEIKNAYESTDIKLDALYTGDDPFAVQSEKEEIDINDVDKFLK